MAYYNETTIKNFIVKIFNPDDSVGGTRFLLFDNDNEYLGTFQQYEKLQQYIEYLTTQS